MCLVLIHEADDQSGEEEGTDKLHVVNEIRTSGADMAVRCFSVSSL